MVKCKHCGKEYSEKGIGSHIWRSHGEGKNFKPSKGKTSWNNGLSKENDERVKKGSIKWKENLNAGKFKPHQLGKPLSEEHKQNISGSMKKAHKERRAWNIGMSRWNNEPSYPEEFFMKVISNEFEDKKYINEYPISI